MINYTEDEKEYLREYLEDDGVTEDQWQDVELMQHHVSMCYDIDIQSMHYTGYPESSVKTSLSYIILEKLGYDFTSIHQFFNIFQSETKEVKQWKLIKLNGLELSTKL